MMYQCQIWADQAQEIWLAADLMDFFVLVVLIALAGWKLSSRRT